MKVMKTNIIFRELLLITWANIAHCSIPGISYMDPIQMGYIKSKLPPGEDPCNPLYWYPRNIPEYCNFRKRSSTTRPVSSELPPTVHPLPPVAPPVAPPMLVPMLPPPIPILPPPIPILPPPIPILPPPTLIAGPPAFPVPLPAPIIPIPTNLYTYSQTNPLPYHPSYFPQSPTGFVPGIHGLVTKDGGINIMPFSDAYADMLEKHKNKIIRKKLHKILDKYKNYPYSKDYRSLRKYEKYFTDD